MTGGNSSTTQRFTDVLRHDVPASLVVFLVAVPLSLGIAVASGAPIAAGLVAAIVGGIVAGALGGSVVQVSGPAAGLSLVVADLVQVYGWRATCAITLAAGVLQIILGAFRVARAALGVSPAVIHGMLAGVGVVIALSQLHIVLGGSPQRSALDNLIEVPAQVATLHGDAVMIGLLTIGVLLVWDRIPKVGFVPAPLAALAIATATAALAGWRFTEVDLANGLSQLAGPILPTGDWHAIAASILLVAVLAGVESLLTCVAADRMHDGPRADLDRELCAQGVANVVSGGLGGLPVSGVVVRTTTNVRAGARSRWSTVLHGVWVLIATIAFASALGLIPMEALAALLLFIGVKMVNLGTARGLRGHGEMPIYFLTMAAVVLLGLAEGILIGLGLAALLALRRLTWVSVEVTPGGGRWRVVVTGSLIFIGVPRLTDSLRTIPRGADVDLLLNVDFMDNAAFEALRNWRLEHERAGGTVEIDELHDDWYTAADNGIRVFPAKTPPKMDWSWLPWSHRRPPEAEADLLEGTREYQRRTAPLIRPLLTRMARKQSPSHLFITCADSRVMPSVITASGPGDLFMVRNVGNLVPRFESVPSDDSVAAAVEYAVGVLGVSTITVCGHSGCGAMAALLGEAPTGLTAVGNWLRHGHHTVERFENTPHGADEPALDHLCRVNVIQQLENLRSYPMVDRLERAGKLELSGLYFDIGTARVHVLDVEGFTPVPELRAEEFAQGEIGRA